MIQGISGVATRDPHEFLAEQAQAVAARWSKQCDDLRASATAWGKGVLTVGTVIIGGFGLSSVTGIFPIDGHLAWLYASLALASILMMAVAAIWLSRRLSRASRTIVMSADLEVMRARRDKNDESALPHVKHLDDNSFTEAELETIAAVYDVFAELNRPNSLPLEQKYTLKDYLQIALDIERKAESADPDIQAVGQRRLPRAAQIRAEVYATQAKAMAHVIRMRVNEATSGGGTIAAMLLFVASLVTVVMFASFASDTRSTHNNSIEHVRQCAEAAKAYREAQDPRLLNLPESCLKPTRLLALP
ncbi:hypothetical protein [Mycolicibacterium aichiense]|uniref:Transmembrane protein n=1 Tax=Mycolicibacterium aichiense TaxID=1799 RepID=A0AAD1MAL8_9MYCO|nr:hypothetical protein [Mycolicibacterium aichiense]MCV7018593.1 hypothetical protein [Mycolicibacterium aichiense]BBX07352.1 hypothetical protein MAIC_21550 [Mycolicibacterium aichiense]